RLGRNQRQGFVRVHAGGRVEQNCHGFRGDGLGIRAEDDGLVLDLELRLVDDNAVYRDPAAFDEQFGFAARAADLLDKAFGKANGVSHEKSRNRRERRLLIFPGAALVRSRFPLCLELFHDQMDTRAADGRQLAFAGGAVAYLWPTAGRVSIPVS
nr:hypothetical protein [Tanacetum cinerariifolium]